MVSSPMSTQNYALARYGEMRQSWPKDVQRGRDLSGRNALLNHSRRIINSPRLNKPISILRESTTNRISYGSVQPDPHSINAQKDNQEDNEGQCIGVHQLKRYGTVSFVGFAVEFTWAALEGCIIPYLLWQGVPVEAVGFIFLANPFVSLVLAGWIGKKSDKMKRRKPFILGLSITAMIGLLILSFSMELGEFFASILQTEKFHVSIVLTFIGYLIAEVSNDMLLIPGRSLAGDIATKYASKHGLDNDAENANSVFTILQTSGRLISLILGSVAVEAIIPSGSCTASEKRCAHLQALCKVAFLILGATCVIAVSCGQGEEQQRDEFAEIEFGQRNQSMNIESQLGELSENEPLLQPLLGRERQNSGVLKSGFNLLYSNPSLFLILLSQIVGWIEIMTLSFYWTAWLGETSVAFAGLAFSGLVALATSMSLKKLNNVFGEVVIYFVGEVSMCICLVATVFIEPNFQSIFLCGLTGFMYSSHQTNAFIIAEISLPDALLEQHQSMIIAILQTSMPLAQVLVAGFSGLLIAFADNHIEVFFCLIGLFGLIIQTVLAVQYIRTQAPDLVTFLSCLSRDE